MIWAGTNAWGQFANEISSLCQRGGRVGSLSTNTMSSPPLTSFCLLFSPAQFHTLPPCLSKPISGIVKLIIAADCWESVTGSAALQSFILFCCEGSLTPSAHPDCEANWKGSIGALDEDKSAGSCVITPTSRMYEEDMQLVPNLLWGGEDDSDVPLIEQLEFKWRGMKRKEQWQEEKGDWGKKRKKQPTKGEKFNTVGESVTTNCLVHVSKLQT